MSIVFILAMKNKLWVACLSLLVLTSCESLKESFKYQFLGRDTTR